LSDSQRPAALFSGVQMSIRVAWLLESRTSLSEIRRRERGQDPELDDFLNAVRVAAFTYDKTGGSTPRKAKEAKARWYTPQQIATQMGVTPHAIRLAIREGRLPATKHGRTWRITPAEYKNYRHTHSPR
jgi:excisionase family DNA binding protein